MNDFEMFTVMMENAKLTWQRLDIHDGDVEMSKNVNDDLNWKRVTVIFRFSKEGNLKWLDTLAP
jgi:hypothetical protein